MCLRSAKKALCGRLALVLFAAFVFAFSLRSFVRHVHHNTGAQAIVIDGDTIKWYNDEGVWETVRLMEMDAPEKGQLCTLGGEEWACGLMAAVKLKLILEQKGSDGTKVRCKRAGKDRFGRTLGVCYACDHAHPAFPIGDACTDVGREMVAQGYAFAFANAEGLVASMYMEEERAARLAYRGMWGGEFERPEALRARKRAALNEDEYVVDERETKFMDELMAASRQGRSSGRR